MDADSGLVKAFRPQVFIALMLAMFAITLGYGVVLPILPFSIERLVRSRDAAAIARDTGLLTGTYAIALFVSAPLWGWISDRLDRRPLIVFGLLGFALTLVLFGLANRLLLLFLTRFLNGISAAAVTPAAYALVGDLALSRAMRAHRFALLNVAATAGFLVGPLIGGLLFGDDRALAPRFAIAGIPAPFLVTAGIAALAAPLVWQVLPNMARASGPVPTHSLDEDRVIRIRLLTIALVTAIAVGAFEVALSLRGKEVLGLDATRIGMLFTECSLVMFAVQGVVFSPLIKPEATRWLLAPGLAALAGGLAEVPFASGYFALVLAVGAVAASAGILSPIVTYWISLTANRSEGAELGLQTAASSLGQALGSAAGGLLFHVAIVPGASFTTPAAAVVVGLAAALGLPRILEHRLRPEAAAVRSSVA